MMAGDAAAEVNFDAIVGPTYNHAATSPSGPGNPASEANRGRPSNPRAAALEGLRKAEIVMGLGARQAVLPPLVRPHLERLHALGLLDDPGLGGADDTTALAGHLAKAASRAPHLLAASFSGACIWTANWATVSPSSDTADGKVHVTPANQSRSFHRSIEAREARALLEQVFASKAHFAFHDPLPGTYQIGDEGAANHLRLVPRHGAPAVNVLVYGRDGFAEPERDRRHFPRQTLEASRAVARLHGLDPRRTLYVKQNPEAIDAGIFHNDVIATANRDLLFYHERAFADPSRAIADIHEAFRDLAGGALRTIAVSSDEVSLADAAVSYLFNSQIIDAADGRTVLVVPRECEFVPAVGRFLNVLRARESGFDAIVPVDVPSSMRSGGGPACLRLRAVLTPEQTNAIAGRVMLDPALLAELRDFVGRRYRETLDERLFADAAFVRECFDVTRELYGILGLAPYGI